MKIPKAGDEDRTRFQSLVPNDLGVEVKPMFGNLGAFVNGNMFMGLFGADIGLKLPHSDIQQLLGSGGGPFGPAERPMSGYVSLPASMTAAEAGPWVAKALAHVGELPQKKPRTAKKMAAGS